MWLRCCALGSESSCGCPAVEGASEAILSAVPGTVLFWSWDKSDGANPISRMVGRES
jgi:hypothetical protein